MRHEREVDESPVEARSTRLHLDNERSEKQEALRGSEKDLIGRGIAGLALGEVVVECDGLHVLPPLEEGRTPQFRMSSSEESAHGAIPSFDLALGLRMTRSTASDLVAKAGGILGDPVVSISAVTEERA